MSNPAREASRHKCLIYEGHPSEQLPVIVLLMMEGLRENRRCLYLGDPDAVASVQYALSEKGVAVSREKERGALVFSSDRSHLAGGRFDPPAMIAKLRELVDDAVRDGFSGLYATGDMRWELGSDENFERLREYEALLEKVFVEKPLSGVCQYHRDTVPARAVRDALLTHRSAYLGRVLNQDNLFYLPPELILGEEGDRGGRLAEWMWRQVSRVARAEEQRDRSLRELEEANRTLERRVRERTADLEAFSFSLSHDLRAQLGHISGFCREIGAKHAGGLDEEGRDYFARVAASASRMGDLIEAMLGLYDVSRRPLESKDVDLSEHARGVVRELRAASPGRVVDVRIQPDVAARGDPRLFWALLHNLIGNAWKFTSKTPDARVEFGAEEKDGERVFYVRDNGAGFDMAHAGKLFKAFQRLHSQAEFPGSGIGLAAVHRILARHGGAIWAESEPGRGARFSFTVNGASGHSRH